MQGNTLRIIDVSGQDVGTQEEINYVCGTVGHYGYTIKNNLLITEINKDFTEGGEVINKYNLANLKMDSVHFLNNSSELYYTDNDDGSYFTDIHCLSHNWLIVMKNGKYGLIEFKILNEEIYFNKVLPTVYDSVEPFGYFHPLKVTKNGLCSYFPISKYWFKSLKPFDKYFCRFTKEKMDSKVG